MEKKLQEGKTGLLAMPKIKTVPEESLNIGKSSSTERYKKIILLTDGNCCSATLNFLDCALQLTNTLHVGQETNADSIYHDILLYTLPSQLFSITIPMKVWTTGLRENNQPYIPSQLFERDIDNDAEVKEWILNILNSEEQAPNNL